ncbi:barstar family protein [Streptomyces sp. NPDC019396]|uniref:barstar family protein n=1 Tax=Streptomyces sp. NPDC019396 TaxID=3154687 RepID=UPI0033E0A52D
MKEEAKEIHISPWMHITGTGVGLHPDVILPTSGHVYVARLNGYDMPDESSAFQQFWEILKFPEYFGWNWHAFYDCLSDLHWLSSDYHILIIKSADLALSKDVAARDEFFRSLWRAGQRWSYIKRPEGVTLSKLSVILSCDKEATSSLAERLSLAISRSGPSIA